MELEILKELARESCRAASSAGAQAADVIVIDGRSVSVEVEKNGIKSCDAEYDAGYSVRAFQRGGVGFSRGRGLDAGAVREAGADAAAMAREAQPDPDFVELPMPAGEGRAVVDGLYDDAVAGFELKRAIDWSLKCVETAREIEPEVIVKCGVGATTAGYAIANTRGVAEAENVTFISISVFSVVRRGEDVGSFYEYTQGRRLEDLKPPEWVAARATERAVSFTGARKIESGEYPVVLGPIAAYDFVRSVIGASSAEEIQRGRSYLAGRRETRIASEHITVVEDPLVTAGLFSSAFDGEGFPRCKATLIDSGVLTSYLHNSYTANKAREKNNGHASRSSYNSDVGIGATNLSIKPGAVTEKELISGISDGLYILIGSISPNSVSGQISGTVDYGYRILNGELAYPVQNAMLGGDVFEFLSGIEAVSSDYREERGNIMPSMLAGRVRIAGGG